MERPKQNRGRGGWGREASRQRRLAAKVAHHFRDQNNLRFEEREYFGKTYPVPFFTYNEHEIWGATGRMLRNFLDVVTATDTLSANRRGVVPRDARDAWPSGPAAS